MEKETEGFVRSRGEASSGRPGFFVACAAMALLESFAFSFHLPSLREGDLGLAQILYLGVREDGLLLLLLAIVFFGGWILARHLDIPLAVNRNKTIVALSILFAIIIVVGRAFSVDEIGVGSYGTFGTIIASRGRFLLSAVMLVGLTLLFYNVLQFAVFVMDRLAQNVRRDKELLGFRKKPDLQTSGLLRRANNVISSASVLKIALLLVACWLPYIVIFFPGCVYQDSADQLNQIFGTAPLSGHHPLFSTYLMAMLVWVGRVLGSDSIGVLLIMLLQVALLSYAFARVVTFVRTQSCSNLLAFTTLLFFALLPLWGSAATSIKKDALFCAFFVLLAVNAFELVLIACDGEESFSDKGGMTKRCVALSLLALLVALVRNDGIAFSAVLMACLIVILLARRTVNGRVIVGCVLGLLFVLATYIGGYKVLAMGLSNAQNGSVIEALSIPVQQTARYYIQASDDVTPEIDEGVSRVLDTDGLRSDVYNPEVSDYVKSVYGRNNIDGTDLSAFFSSYLAMGLNHPMIFADAFVDQTLGWWYPEALGAPDSVVGGMGLYQNHAAEETYSQFMTVRMPLYDSSVADAFIMLIGCFGYVPLFGTLVYPAIYGWLLLAVMAYLRIRGGGVEMLMFLPFLLYFAICIASPVSGLSRYALPVMASIPMLMAWALRISAIRCGVACTGVEGAAK